MEQTYLLNYPGVKKKILAGGQGPMPHFPPGAKLVFHFQTLLDNFERTVIDDSRLADRPPEIFVGKMFKMEVWETLLTSMRVGEVAEFWCDAIHTGLYPIVSKGMRLIAQGKDPLEGQKHMCGMGNLFHYHSTGFPELDEIMRNPQPLIFIMELLQVGDPMSYHRESWMMEKDEKLQTVPILHMQGNALVKQKQYREAASKYKEAVLLLKVVQSREMPGDADYINLGRMIVPLELNYCQCMLELEEYYENVLRDITSEPKLTLLCGTKKKLRETSRWSLNWTSLCPRSSSEKLRALSERMKEKYWEEKERYWNKLEKMEGKSEEEEVEKRQPEDPESVTASTEDTPQDAAQTEEDKENKVAPYEGGKEEASCSAVSLSSCHESEGKDWQQMLQLITSLQNQGNLLIKERRFREASFKFEEALEYVDELKDRVDEQGDLWQSLEKVSLPVVLNLSQCKLELKQYQRVVELNSQLLEKHKDNFKAVYQRARAHAALCNEDEAHKDFALAEKLDPNFKPFVRQELKKMAESVRAMHARQNKTYWDTTREKWGHDGGAARQKHANCASKVTEGKKEDNEAAEGRNVQEEENSEGNCRRDDDAAAAGGKEEQNERAGEEGLDKENIEMVKDPQVGPSGADNHSRDKDSDSAAASPAKDNAVSKRSVRDKGKKKVKCQSAWHTERRRDKP
ncbi:Aryl-hydrocarbon-interacting protein-like 1 [Oryzias melastigma]|uniref:Aryl-hydrocarbon-interacting protein-like 1 n=1 Tax=Oryzias melastigma TaxID=30732 RepID=A0A834FEU1_ORYME|nr:Aryl-hydrocarbon-interacting protein-like 1 [Oryzias melastigma]